MNLMWEFQLTISDEIHFGYPAIDKVHIVTPMIIISVFNKKKYYGSVTYFEFL